MTTCNEEKSLVIAVHKERYVLYDEIHGEFYGKLKASNYYHDPQTYFPVTGDWVKCQYNPIGDSMILETQERKSFIQRFDAWTASNAQAIAANVDEIFILTSANHDFNLKRLHRYLAACRQGTVNCTILITKADTTAEIDKYMHAVEMDMPDTEVIPISAKTGWNLEKVSEKMVPGSVSVFLGSSGVGKSTLVNALAGKEIMDVNGIREDDSKGRHTTTHRQMVFLDSGAMVIDVPGMRELALLDAEEGLNQTFVSVSELERMCRFSDCTHKNEPGCAVQEALKNGTLLKATFDEFKALQAEAKRMRRDKAIMVSKYRKELRKTPKGRR